MSDGILPCPACKGVVGMRKSFAEGVQYACECGARGPIVTWVRDDVEATWAAAVAAWNAMSREPAPLVWSSERPKVAGKYYLRVMTSEGWRVEKDFLDVTEWDLKTPRFWLVDGYQAAGPIPEPVEAQS